MRNDGYEERGGGGGGGQKIVVECLQFWPKLGHLICQGLTPPSIRLRGHRSKGTSEGNGLGFLAHMHTHKQTHKHA